MADHAIDVTSASFEQQVLEASHDVPVLVDFWAPWCGPCRALTPVLEKLAAEYGGKFRLAKINSDEEPSLAAKYGVRGIPNVKAFVGGRLVDEFTGALPASEVRRFLDSLVPTPAELDRRRARAALAAGRAEEAIAILGATAELAPDDDGVRLDLADALVEAGRVDEADRALASIRPHIDRDGTVEQLRTRIAALRARASGPDTGDLLRAIEADGTDLEARFALANRFVADRDYAGALAQLLEIVRQKRAWHDDAARKLMVSIFQFAQDDPDLVSRYRRELAGLLH